MAATLKADTIQNAASATANLSLDTSGNVGIGTSSPAYKLAVNGLIGTQASSGNVRLETGGALNSGYIAFYDTSVSVRSGYVGFATLAGSGTVNLYSEISGNSIAFATNGGSGTTERARIFSSGGVSIGNTTDPGAANLSVSGTIADSTAVIRPQISYGEIDTSTSQTAYNFTNIPSWVTQITFVFNGVSLNSTAVDILIQLGTSAGLVTSGYTGTTLVQTTAPASGASTPANGFSARANSASSIIYGTMTIALIGSNKWAYSISARQSATGAMMGGGSVSLPGTLDRVTITNSATGTNTFDAGSVNIIYS